MSLAPHTLTKNEIKLLHTNNPGICLLNPGPNPTNSRACVACITTQCNALDIDHLLHAEFNCTATSHNTNNKLQMLKVLQAASASSSSSSSSSSIPTALPSPSPESKTPSTTPPSTSTPPTQVKHEYVPLATTTTADIVTYSSHGARTTSVANSAHYFGDPVDEDCPGVAEPSAARKARMSLWKFIVACCYHHAHLTQGLRVGDIFGVMKAITNFGLSHGPEDNIDGIKAMTALTKKGRNWHDFVSEVSRVRTILARETNPARQLGNQILPDFVLGAMDEDKNFELEITLLRSTYPTPNLDHIMSSLSIKARTLRPRHLAAHAATTPAPTTTPPTPRAPAGGKEICRNFARDGKCKFQVPAIGRFCKHSHGPANDKATAEARAAYNKKHGLPKGKAGTAAATKVKAPPSATTDSCYRCGSKLHGIDDCVEVRGNMASATNTFDATQVAQILSYANGLQQPAGTDDDDDTNANLAGNPASIASSDPLGIGVHNCDPPVTSIDFTVNAMDRELARLFKRASG